MAEAKEEQQATSSPKKKLLSHSHYPDDFKSDFTLFRENHRDSHTMKQTIDAFFANYPQHKKHQKRLTLMRAYALIKSENARSSIDPPPMPLEQPALPHTGAQTPLATLNPTRTADIRARAGALRETGLRPSAVRERLVREFPEVAFPPPIHMLRVRFPQAPKKKEALTHTVRISGPGMNYVQNVTVRDAAELMVRMMEESRGK